MTDCLSASQVEAWLRCRRYWAWTYLGGIRLPSTPAQVVGTTGHEIAESWLRDGTPPPRDLAVNYVDKHGTEQVRYPGQIFEKGLHYWPPPGIAQVERPWFGRTPAGDWTGFVDVTAARLGASDTAEWVPYGTPGSVPVIGDHKFTSDLQYAKTPAELRRDPQALSYGADVVADLDCDFVDFQWVYYHTGSKGAKRVQLRMHRDEIEAGAQALDHIGSEIWDAYEARRHPLDHAPNPGACGMYGGCGHRDRCNLSTLEIMRGLMTETNERKSFADVLAEKRAAAGSAPTGAHDPIALATAAGWAVHPSNPAYMWKGSETATREQIAGMFPAPPPPPPALNPPEAPAIVIPPVAPEVSGIPAIPGIPVAPAAPAPASSDDGPNRDAVLARAAQLGIEVPKGTRTATVQGWIDARGNAPAAPVAPPAAPQSSDGPILYVDCAPIGLPISTLDEVIAPLAARVAASLGVPHYSMADFGKGPGALAAAVAAEHPAMPAHVVTSSRSPLYQAVRGSLRVARVVQGLA